MITRQRLVSSMLALCLCLPASNHASEACEFVDVFEVYLQDTFNDTKFTGRVDVSRRNDLTKWDRADPSESGFKLRDGSFLTREILVKPIAKDSFFVGPHHCNVAKHDQICRMVFRFKKKEGRSLTVQRRQNVVPEDAIAVDIRITEHLSNSLAQLRDPSCIPDDVDQKITAVNNAEDEFLTALHTEAFIQLQLIAGDVSIGDPNTVTLDLLLERDGQYVFPEPGMPLLGPADLERFSVRTDGNNRATKYFNRTIKAASAETITVSLVR